MTRASLLLAFVLLAAPVAAQDLTGRWVGSYRCGQGETGLTLQVDRGKNTRLRALFHFYPPPDNPAAAQGCFEMTGDKVGQRTGSFGLTASRWLLRPEGYVTVDLDGQISADGQTFTGAVRGPACTSFTLRRSTARSAPPDACAPSPAIAAR